MRDKHIRVRVIKICRFNEIRLDRLHARLAGRRQGFFISGVLPGFCKPAFALFTGHQRGEFLHLVAGALEISRKVPVHQLAGHVFKGFRLLNFLGAEFIAGAQVVGRRLQVGGRAGFVSYCTTPYIEGN